jgi:Cof subfamily protein (haloacid dehalogenase superfamily)
LTVVLNQVRLVASDLDGTLIAHGTVVSERTVDVLRAVSKRGVEVVAVTGRSHWSAVNILRPVGCIRWIICSNGATVYDFEAEAVVQQRPLSDRHVADVVTRLAEAFPTAGFAWESAHGIFHSERWIRNRQATDARFVADKDRPPRSLTPEDGPILKLMVAHHELTTYDWLDALCHHMPDGVNVSTSGASFVEVTRADANKGDALRHLCQELGVDQAETIAFGDHANDLPMLDWVGAGYAMANADPRVLAVADHSAPHHAEDGVAQVLERLL